MKKMYVALFALGLSLVVACGPSRPGNQDTNGVYNECYRILLSESTQTVEGRARQVATRQSGTWVLETVDGVAYVKAGRKYVDGYIKLDCSVLGF